MRLVFKSNLIFFAISSFLLFTLVLGNGVSYAQTNDNIAGEPPITFSFISPEKPAETSLKNGLQVTYYLKFFKRDLNYINKMKPGEFKSFEGKPITHLDHQFGKNEVFDSGTSRGVALRMKGYLFFPEAGMYSMQALSNDGVFIYLSGELVISDPKQHADSLSQVANITINKAGWYQLHVDYFQRKGTAALKLLWKTPTNSKFVAIPASSYGH